MSDTEAVPDCQGCGACCAYSRDWPMFIGERDGAGIPARFRGDGGMRCEGDRCSALAGTIGSDVHCLVYEDRPLVCMEFAAGSEACHMVRTRFGLERAAPAAKCSHADHLGA